MLGGADNPNGELLSYIIGADNYIVPGDPAIEYVQTHSAPQPIPARINRFVTVRIG